MWKSRSKDSKSPSGRSSSAGSWKRRLGKLSSVKHHLASEQPQAEKASPLAAEGLSNKEPSSTPSSVSIQPSAVNITSNDVTGVQPTELTGLWKEAYEQLLQDPNNEKLIKAYETALLQDASDDNDASQVESDVSSRLQSVIGLKFEEIKKSQTKFYFAGKEIILKEQVRQAVNTFLSVQDIITAAVSSEPHAALAWAGALVLMGPVIRSVTQDADATEGFEYITGILARYAVMECNWPEIYSTANKSNQSKQLQALALSIKAQTVKLYAKILQFQMRLARHYSRRGYFRAMKDFGAPDDWKGMQQTLVTIGDSISRDLEEMSSDTLLDIKRRLSELHELNQDSRDLMIEIKHETQANKNLQLFSSLRIAPEAEFKSQKIHSKDKCFDGTQVDVLKDIQDWIVSPRPEHIYWLSGMVGMGKSTISRTIAGQCANRESLPGNTCLGGSFFFDKNEGEQSDSTYLFPTLCRSLAESLPELKVEICKSIEEHPNIANESLSHQWKHLILQPFLNLESQNRLLPLTFIVVIDALDECKSRYEGDDVDTILKLIAEAHQLKFIRIKFFLTSRPEGIIRSSFNDLAGSMLHIKELHKMLPSFENDHPADDITRFLKHKLRILADRRGLGAEWPGEDRFNELVKKADGLWIYAATAYGFIGDSRLKVNGLVDRRLMILLREDNDVKDHPPEHNLDVIYARVLQDSLLDGTVPEERELIRLHFQRTVGAIIVLCQPLSLTTISDLLSMRECEIQEIIDSLGSVLHKEGGKDSAIRLAHLSFTDFLTNEKRCLDENFQISKHEKHTELFIHCLETLQNTMREDICCLGDYSIQKDNIDPQNVKKWVPAHVQYVCLYWVEHLQSGDCSSFALDEGPVHILLQTHLLHWLESLSIIGRISDGVRCVIKLSEYLTRLPTNGRSNLCELVYDIKRFILTFRSIIETAPLQVYRSVLIYCPTQSLVRRQYEHVIPEWIISLPIVEKNWSPLLQTLQDEKPRDVAFSPDGKIVASSTVSLWDTSTGTLLKTLNPMGRGENVTFSSNGKEVVSLSSQGNLRVWEVSSGRLIKEIQNPVKASDWGNWNLVSSDRTRSVSLIKPCTVVLLDIDKGQIIKVFEPHKSGVEYFSISPNGQLFATTSVDGEVRIWSAITGDLRHDFEPDFFMGANNKRVAISHDCQTIGVACDKGIFVWSLKEQVILNHIKVNTKHTVFSSMSSLLMSSEILANNRTKVHWWKLDSDKAIRTIIDNDFMSAIQLSPDGKLFAPIAMDYRRGYSYQPWGKSFLKIWDATSGDLLKVLDGHTSSIKSCSFSRDGSLLASAGADSTIRLWDLTSQYVNESLERFNSRFMRVRLSPDHQHVAILGYPVCLRNLRTNHSKNIETKNCNHTVFSPDGRLFANPVSPSADEIWSLDTGEVMYTFPKDNGGYECFAFSANSELFAEAYCKNHRFAWKSEKTDKATSGKKIRYNDGLVIRIWEMKTGRLHQDCMHSGDNVNSLAFSPDGRFLAAVIAESQGLSIWNVSNGEIYVKLPTYSGDIAPDSLEDAVLAWSPNKPILASASSGGKILLWNTAIGTVVGSFGGLSSTHAIAFSPDGKLLACSSNYPTNVTQLWDIQTGSLIGTRHVSADSPSCLRFSPDGTAIETSMGRVDVGSFYPGTESISRLDLAVEDNWLLLGHEKITLPHDYQVHSALATEDLLVMGHISGRVTFLRVKPLKKSVQTKVREAICMEEP